MQGTPSNVPLGWLPDQESKATFSPKRKNGYEMPCSLSLRPSERSSSADPQSLSLSFLHEP